MPKSDSVLSSRRSRAALLAVGSVLAAGALVWFISKPPAHTTGVAGTPDTAQVGHTKDAPKNVTSLAAAGLPIPFKGTLAVDQSATAATQSISSAEFEIDADGRFGGTVGCNQIMGDLQSSGNRLTFTGFGMTQMMCEESLMAVENAYTDYLQTNPEFLVRDGALVLKPGTDEELVFTQSDDN